MSIFVYVAITLAIVLLCSIFLFFLFDAKKYLGLSKNEDGSFTVEAIEKIERARTRYARMANKSTSGFQRLALFVLMIVILALSAWLGLVVTPIIATIILYGQTLGEIERFFAKRCAYANGSFDLQNYLVRANLNDWGVDISVSVMERAKKSRDQRMKDLAASMDDITGTQAAPA